MADFLVYWKYFWRETRDDPNNVGEDWSTARESVFKQIKPGDRIWVVVTGGSRRPAQWRLLQRIVARRKGTNWDADWPYEVLGDPQGNQRFDVLSQSDFAPLLRRLEFASGNRIRFRGTKIGKTLQSPRKLSGADGDLLLGYSRNLTLTNVAITKQSLDQPRRSLLKLVEYVFEHRDGLIEGITYQTLATWIERTNKHGVGHAHGMGDVLGKMGHLLQGIEDEWGEPVPHIQSLVVQKTGSDKGLPDEGIREFWPDYPKMSRAEKRNRVSVEHKRIVDFGSRWNDVLDKLGLPEVTEEQLPRRFPYGRGGESIEHKAFKQYIHDHPELVGAGSNFQRFQEYSLPSNDTIDVLFKSRDGCIAVEVKSSRSDLFPDDYVRGLYQSIKYGALLRAMAQAGSYSIPSEIKSLLVLESSLPDQFRGLARILGVIVIENARAAKPIK